MKTKSNSYFHRATILLILIALLGIGGMNPEKNTCTETGYSSVKSVKNDSAFPAANTTGQKINTIDVGASVKEFKSVLIDSENVKWFLTDAGLLSFDDKKWTLHNQNRTVESSNVQGIALELDAHKQELWLATPAGVMVAGLPVDAASIVNSYNTKNSALLSDTVVKVAVGQSPLRWFGTPKGISALKEDKWLTPSYDDQYPPEIFEIFPILSMATDIDGDTLYVGMKGAGVTRVFSNEVDGITGASVYAQWGPIILPSDSIYSICIQSNNVKWFGTDMGVARHIGQNTLENWDVFTTEEGLINDFVQAIAADKDGNVWFGTKGGISVYNGNEWKSYTQEDGLVSDNVLCIAADKSGVIWIGTDNGVSSLNNSKFTCYK